MAKQRSLEEIEEMKKWDRMSPAQQHEANLITEFGKVGYSSLCGSNTVELNEGNRGLR